MSTNWSTWRKRNSFVGHLYIEPLESVYTARVNQSSFTYPIAEITYDTGSGTLANVKVGMLICFGSSAGKRDLGYSYIRKTPSGSIFYVGYSPQGHLKGELDLINDAYITVYNNFIPFTKNQRITSDGVVYKDYDVSYSGENAPVVNMGSHFAIFSEDPYTTTLSSSESFSPTGETITARNWSCSTATPTTSTSTSQSFEFAVGKNNVYLSLTSSSGTRTGVRKIVVCDNNTQGYFRNFAISSHQESSNGNFLSINILGNLNYDDYMEGCLVIYWEDEYYDNVKEYSGGLSGREHIKFVGFIDEIQEGASANEKGVNYYTSITCSSVTNQYAKLPSYSYEMTYNVDPSKWGESSNTNIRNFVSDLLLNHSTIPNQSDIILPSGMDLLKFFRLGLDEKSFGEQLKEISKAVSCGVSDYRGNLVIYPIENYMDELGGNTLFTRKSTTYNTFQDEDISSIQYIESGQTTKWLNGSGVKADITIETYFCQSPGISPSQGKDTQSADRRLVRNQAELNSQTGHMYAELNSELTSMQVEFVYSGDFGYSITDFNWYMFNISDLSYRDLDLSNVRFFIESISIEYNPLGYKKLSMNFRMESIGIPSVTIIIPERGQRPPRQPTTPTLGNPGRMPRIGRRPPYPNRPPDDPNPYAIKPTDPDEEPPYVPNPANDVGGSGGGYTSDPNSPTGQGNSIIYLCDDNELRVEKNFINVTTLSNTKITPSDRGSAVLLDVLLQRRGKGAYLLGYDEEKNESFVWRTDNVWDASVSWTKGEVVSGYYSGLLNTNSGLFLFGQATPNYLYHEFKYMAELPNGVTLQEQPSQGGDASNAFNESELIPLSFIPYTANIENPGFITNHFQWIVYEVDGERTGNITVRWKRANLNTGVAYVDTFDGSVWTNRASWSIILNTSAAFVSSNTWVNSGAITYKKFRVRVFSTKPQLQLVSVSAVSFPKSLYSTDGGDTYATPEDIIASNATIYGYDSNRVGDDIYIFGNAQLRTSSSGTYSNYGSVAPTSPLCLHIPRTRIGTILESGNSNASNPEYFIGSSDGLWKCTSAGTVFTLISPTSTIIQSRLAITTLWKDSRKVAIIGLKGAFRKLFTSLDGGTNWTERHTLSAKAECIVGRGDGQLYITNGRKIAYSSDWGVNYTNKIIPENVICKIIRVYGA